MSRLARRRRDARRRAGASPCRSPASTTSTTRSRPTACCLQRGHRPRARSRRGLESFAAAFGRAERSTSAGATAVDPADQEPGRRERGVPHADATRPVTARRRARPVDRPQRPHRRRARHLVDLGRRLRDARAGARTAWSARARAPRSSRCASSTRASTSSGSSVVPALEEGLDRRSGAGRRPAAVRAADLHGAAGAARPARRTAATRARSGNEPATGRNPEPREAVWHDLECGSYRADLALWQELAAAAAADDGRAECSTSAAAPAAWPSRSPRRAHASPASTVDPELLAELRPQARRRGGCDVATVDGRRALVRPRRTGSTWCWPRCSCSSCSARPRERMALLARVRAHLRPGGPVRLLPCSTCRASRPTATYDPPLPDMREQRRLGLRRASRWRSAASDGGRAISLDRVRRAVSPTGSGRRARSRRCDSSWSRPTRSSARLAPSRPRPGGAAPDPGDRRARRQRRRDPRAGAPRERRAGAAGAVAVPGPHEHLCGPRQHRGAGAPLRAGAASGSARGRRPGRSRRSRTPTTSSTWAAARTATRRWSPATWSRPSARRIWQARSTRGAAMLAVCGGYQLLGHSYELAGRRAAARPRPGRPAHGARAGPAPDRQRRDRGRPRRRPAPPGRLREPRRPHLPRRRRAAARHASSPGSATTASDGHEGVRRGRLIGTYLHGPLLPKNAWLADRLIEWALERRHGDAAGAGSRWTTRSRTPRTTAPCGRRSAVAGRSASARRSSRSRRSARTVSGSASTSANSSCSTRDDHELGDAVARPRSRTARRGRCSAAAPASRRGSRRRSAPARSTSAMPCRAARPERGSTRPAWPSGIATAMPVPTLARSPGPSVRGLGGEAGRSRRRARVRARGACACVARGAGTRRSLAGSRRGRCSSERRAAAPPRAAGTRACTRTPAAVSSRSRSPASSCSSDSTRAALERDQQLDRRRGARGSCARSARRSSSRPSPVERRDEHGARGGAARSHAPLVVVQQVGLVQDQQARARPRRRSRRARRRPRAIISSSSSSGADASTTCRIRSALTVSSSVALNASTSWWGSLRMNPTVSVSR